MFRSEDPSEFYSVGCRNHKELGCTRGLLQKTKGSNSSLSQQEGKKCPALHSSVCPKCPRIWSKEFQCGSGVGCCLTLQSLPTHLETSVFSLQIWALGELMTRLDPTGALSGEMSRSAQLPVNSCVNLKCF